MRRQKDIYVCCEWGECLCMPVRVHRGKNMRKEILLKSELRSSTILVKQYTEQKQQKDREKTVTNLESSDKEKVA